MLSLPTLQSLLDSVGLHYELAQRLALFTLVMARVTAAIVFAPFLGGQSVPTTIKAGLGFVLSAAMLPSLLPGAAPPPSGTLFVALLAKEALIGATLGFLAQLVFYAVQMAGTLVDTQRGLNQITFLAPQLDGHPSALGALQFQAALVIFFAMRGHLMFIGALMKSFRQLPIVEIPQMSHGIAAITDQAARVSANALLLGCQIAAPVVLAVFLVDVTFAMAARASAQMRINAETFTAKALVGLGFVCLLTAIFLEQLSAAFSAMANSIQQFIDIMR